MRRLRILVLMHPDFVPPDSADGYTAQEINKWKTEYDVVSTLRGAGHNVRPLGVQEEIKPVRDEIENFKPHVVFTLLEEFHYQTAYDQHIASFLELMKVPYTGCNPRGLVLARGKDLSKTLVHYHRIPVPAFAVFPLHRKVRRPKRLALPLIVKSLSEDASWGISQASVVDTDEKLAERVAFIHERIGTAAIAEQFIEGRELYVGVLGNDRLRTLPVWEMDFGTLPDVMAGIATRKVKWDRRYQKKHGIRTGAAQNLPEGCAAYLDKLSKRIFRSLYLSGYARMDFRMRPDGSVFVLEANCNPNISREEDLADSALAAGMEYPALLEQIIRVGNNYQAAWRADEE